MSLWTLIRRSLRFYARAHLGVLLGATVGSAALVGALLVGDSVRVSLHDLALARLGRVDIALAANDRLFRAQLADDISSDPTVATNGAKFISLMELPGTASTQDGSARANNVQILGVDNGFWQLAEQPPASLDLTNDTAALSEALAAQLHAKVGDLVLLRIQKPSLLSRDAPISSQNDLSIAWRLKVQAIVSDAQFGRFSLQASQVAPFNAFVNLTQLQTKVAQTNRANLLLAGSLGGKSLDTTNAANLLRAHWQLADAELEVRELPANGGAELRSSRVFIDPEIVKVADPIVRLGKNEDWMSQPLSTDEPVLSYFVNELRSPPFLTPYSLVTAMGAPIVPANMDDNQILINQWLAEDLDAKTGDPISLTYFVIGNGRALEERTANFIVRGVIPIAGAAADRRLMPDFPGLADAESSSDWDAGFPIQMKRIRPKDEQYWKDYRGTPKAFITLAAGRKLWANRFGDTTAIRFPNASADSVRKALMEKIDPANVGLVFQPMREQALLASSQAVDFGGLFIGFSFFLIVAALLLMALLFQFGLEQRAKEIGTLLALGFRPRLVRRLFLGEGAILALAGGIIGAAGGIIYAKAMLIGLATIWRNAVGTSALQYHATAPSLAIGVTASTLVSLFTIWLTLRRQARRPARELLAQGAEEKLSMGKVRGKGRLGWWIGFAALLGAAACLAPSFSHGGNLSPEVFFNGGSLLLIAGLGFSAAWLGKIGGRFDARRELTAAPKHFTLGGLALRGCGRRRKRSLATIGLLASGVFMIVAIGAFRIDARQESHLRSSGAGGFALIGDSTLPVTYDLNSQAGREFYGHDQTLLKSVRIVALRVHDGDEASCLNLNRAQTPRLLGVNVESLQSRQAFTFTEQINHQTNGWGLLNTNLGPDEIPAIGDENSIIWAMGKKIGDTIDYVDEHGHPFKVRLVGALANSILQGNLIIDEKEFIKRFPGESGYRMFLIEAPFDTASKISGQMSRALQDAGMEIVPAAQRLNAFNAVQNTYLSTFQVLGGLGLLLGSVGLGVVVLRNVQERRSEFGLLLAIGFTRRTLHSLVLREHIVLLGLGLGLGIIAAIIGILPALLSPGSQIPYASMAITLTVLLLNGLLWTWLATWFALRGKLLDALRNE